MVVKNEVIAAYSDLIDVGWVEDIDYFKDNVDVARATDNPNRINFLFPDDLVNQLRTTAALIRFKT
jgi:phage tail sheath gpL-like